MENQSWGCRLRIAGIKGIIRQKEEQQEGRRIRNWTELLTRTLRCSFQTQRSLRWIPQSKMGQYLGWHGEIFRNSCWWWTMRTTLARILNHDWRCRGINTREKEKKEWWCRGRRGEKGCPARNTCCCSSCSWSSSYRRKSNCHWASGRRSKAKRSSNSVKWARICRIKICFFCRDWGWKSHRS